MGINRLLKSLIIEPEEKHKLKSQEIRKGGTTHLWYNKPFHQGAHVGELSATSDLRAGPLRYQLTVQIWTRTLYPNITAIEADKGIFFFFCSCQRFSVLCWSPGMFNVTSLLFAEPGPGAGEPHGVICRREGAQHLPGPAS